MSERTELVNALVKNAGLTPEEASLRLEDGDLWLLPPEMRYVTDDPKEWEDASAALVDLSETAGRFSPAARAIIEDANVRALELASRVRERNNT
jgi:hypothetical protein